MSDSRWSPRAEASRQVSKSHGKRKKTSITSEGITRKKGQGMMTTASTSEGPSQRIDNKVLTADYEHFMDDDAEYADKLQLQEALHASVYNGTLSMEPQVFCEICLENIESWQMFANDQCSHSFCCECTTNHIMAKIQDREKAVTCPAPNCEARLNPDACRLMIPEYLLVQWDTLQCLSLIPESSKLYCPFTDCSAMLVNDSELDTAQVKCAACKRKFCCECRVPWHRKLTCEEFQNANEMEKEDKQLEKLALKRKWQKCPKCEVYVEKTEGCLHITCRCKYEFCYRCGVKWYDSHDGNCRGRPS